MEAVALTDHGRAGGLLQFKKACIKHGVRPIYGAELYMCPPCASRTLHEKIDNYKTSYHLVILAKNEEGMKNLFRLTSIGWLDGFYYKPRVDIEALREFSEGLVVLSGCAGGFIPNMLMEDREHEAIEFGEIMREIFKDDFYIEVQDHGISWQEPLKNKLVSFAEKNGFKSVITQDSHFIEESDADLHAKICKLAAGDLEFESTETYFKSEEEIKKRFNEQHWYMLDTTNEIADKCQVEWNFGETIWPIFDLPEGISSDKALQEATKKGFKEKIIGQVQDINGYRERIRYELDVIRNMGFATYFLVVADFIGWAIQNNIPVGPGRGSGAGSLVCYCIGITDIDPIRYGLYFERFLNPARVSLPDIDVDFCPRGRKDVMQYVSEKYGADRVAQIGTYAAFKPRGSLRDFARVCGYEPKVGDVLAALVPADVAGFSLPFKEVIEARPQLLHTEYSDVVDFAIRAEGLRTKMGVHAAGVVISDRPLMEQLPLFRGKHDEIATQFDMHDVESLGLVKYDFLGLINLTVIKDTIDLVKELRGIDVKIEENDEKVFKEIFQTGDLDGVFQFETSSGFRDLCVKVKPTSIEDLSTITALFRPGPLSTGLTNKYVEGRRGAQVNYITPELEPILADTYGVMCLSEGTMIKTSDIKSKKIEEITEGDNICTSDGYNIWQGQVDKIYKSTKHVVKINTSSGKSVCSSLDHLWLTQDGNCKTNELKTKITKSYNGPVSKIGNVLHEIWMTGGKQEIDPKKTYLLGLLIGDGELKSGTKAIACSTKRQAKFISLMLSDVFGGEPKIYQNTRAWYAYSKFNTAPNKSPLTLFLDEQYGRDKWISKSRSKKLPPNVLNYNKEARINLVKGLWDADGHYGQNLIYYRSLSKELLHDIGNILSSLKIAYAIRKNYIHIVDRFAFCKIIGFPLLPDKLYESNTDISYIPAVPVRILRDILKKKNIIIEDKNLKRRLRIDGLYKPKGKLSAIWKIHGFEEAYEEAYWISYKKDSFPVFIEEINNIGTKNCYDIQMKDQNFPYFIANSIVSHNCYQEQIMRMCVDLAGYTASQADDMRKAIGKKDKEKMAKHQELFINGCDSNKIDKQVAEKLYEDIKGFAKYSFNKAHSVAYSVISYRTAWLKYHYPEEFYCALFNNTINEKDQLIKYIHSCRDRGIPIEPPDVNRSAGHFTVDHGTIMFGLAGIKGVGEKACDHLLETRPQEGFTNLSELIKKKVNAGTLKALAASGSLQAISTISPSTLTAHMNTLVDYHKKLEKWEERKAKWEAREEEKKQAVAAGHKPPRSLPKVPDPPLEPELHMESQSLPESSRISKQLRLSMERETLGFYISGHPLDDFPGLYEKSKWNIEKIREDGVPGATVKIPVVISSLTKKRTRRGHDMGITIVEDRTGRIEATVFPKAWKKLKDKIEVDKVALAICKIDRNMMRDEEVSLVKLVLEDIDVLSEEDKDFYGESVIRDIEIVTKDGTKLIFQPDGETKLDLWQKAKAIATNLEGTI